jgi:hypothetical protein
MLPETLNVFGYQATGIDRYAFVFAGGFVFFFVLVFLEHAWSKALGELNDDLECLARDNSERRFDGGFSDAKAGEVE